MYAIVEDNNITQYINFPKSVVIGDVRYPAKIFELWTTAEKEAIGIYEIVVDKTNYKDPAYYINTNSTYTFADGQVTESWGTATPKRLNDENAIDENGDPVLDDDGVQLINYGLKTQKKRIVKQQASGLLEKTDWHNHKALDDDTYTIPENVKTYRANVRSKSNEMETQIDACTNVDELKTLYEYVNTGTEENPVIERPLAEFPKEI
ncbi:N-acetylmuramidase/lysin [uncultured Mediterranean phage uvMED]|nr:N-acetylmuramidase/lysin [uncultured Mediterranean phage uvMED]